MGKLDVIPDTKSASTIKPVTQIVRMEVKRIPDHQSENYQQIKASPRGKVNGCSVKKVSNVSN